MRKRFWKIDFFNPDGDTGIRYMVLFGLCCAATIAYICRNSLAVVEKTIREDTGISEKQMGLIISLFFFTYALGQIPTGWFADRIGSRLALPIFSVMWSGATALFSVFSGFAGFLSSRIINGVAQAGLFPGCTNTISKWFPATGRAFPSGSLSSFMSIGGAVAALLTGLLVPLLGWRMTFALYAIPGVVWAVLFYFLFRNTPREHALVSEGELARIEAGRAETPDVEPERGPTPWSSLLTSSSMWWINAQQFFRAAGYVFFASWFPTYLQETRGVSLEGAAYLTMAPLLAVVCCSPLGGALSDWVIRKTGSRVYGRKYVAASCLFVCAALVFSAYFVRDARLATAIISLGMVWFALGGPCSYAVTIDMGGRHVATVFSMMNMSGNIGAALLPAIVPWFREAVGSWDPVLFLFGACFLGASLSWLMLDTSGTVFDHSWIAPPEEESS